MAAMMTSDFSESFTNHEMFDLPSTNWMDKEVSTGTTIAAVEFKDGVVIGADSRTTTGAYIANRVSNKLTKVTDYIYCCRSGSAADTEAVSDIVHYHLSFYRMELGEQPRVRVAAHIFKDLCYNYRDSITAGVIVAGWDKHRGGQVFSIPIGGMITRMPFAIGGSGSTYLYGYVDANYKEAMTKEECLKFTANALALAMSRDGSSGGIINLAAITKHGVEKIILTGDEIPKFNEEF